FRGDFGNGITGSFRSERGRARYPRVDLDANDFVVVVRVQCKLNVTTSGKLTDPIHHLDGEIAHLLISSIRQRHRRSDCDRVTGVNSHRIKVLDRTYDDDVSYSVSEKFELVLLPSEDALFNQDFVDWRSMKTAVKCFVEVFRFFNKTASCTSQCI